MLCLSGNLVWAEMYENRVLKVGITASIFKTKFMVNQIGICNIDQHWWLWGPVFGMINPEPQS